MSTEAIATPHEAEKSKKRKKDQDRTEERHKKRKREEDPQPATEETPDLRKKKRKSEKTRHSEAVEEPQSFKKEKNKRKHGRKDKSHGHTASQQQNTSQSTSTSHQDELLQLHSPFTRKTVSFYLALSPCAHDFPLEGLCAEHISPLLLTYYAPLNGIVLGFERPRLSEQPEGAVQAQSDSHAKEVLARSINEYAVTFVWLTVDFVLFQPVRGKWLEGYVGLQNESLLGLICYNYFNAAVAREKLPVGWRWVSEDDGVGGGDASSGKKKDKKAKGMIDDHGYFVDGQGKPVEGRILFQVEDFEATPGSDGSGGTVSIIGTLRPSP